MLLCEAKWYYCRQQQLRWPSGKQCWALSLELLKRNVIKRNNCGKQKAQRKMRKCTLLFASAQRNFRNLALKVSNAQRNFRNCTLEVNEAQRNFRNMS